MLNQPEIENLLFFDIETVSVTKKLAELSEVQQKHFNKWLNKNYPGYHSSNECDLDANDMYEEHAALYPEFAKIVCISCGVVKFTDGAWKSHIKSFSGDDEAAILRHFAESLNKFFNATAFPQKKLCGQNIKGFDIPVVAKRMLINGMMNLPDALRIFGKKPWEINCVDTKEMWQMGVFGGFSSLELLCDLLGIPSPKTDMDGSQVGAAYYYRHEIEKITKYCEQDVQATMNLVLRLSGFELIAEAPAV